MTKTQLNVVTVGIGSPGGRGDFHLCDTGVIHGEYDISRGHFRGKIP